MSVTITVSFETSRGQAKLSADLTGMNFTEMTSEVKQFFTAALVVRCDILKQNEESQKIQESVITPVEHHPELEEVMVIS